MLADDLGRILLALSVVCGGCACEDDAGDDGGDADTDVDSDSDSDGDSDGDTDTGTETGSDTETESGSGSDTDTDPTACNPACAEGQWCVRQPDAPSVCADDCALVRRCTGSVCCPAGSLCVDGICPLADLSVDEAQLEASVTFDTFDFSAGSCSFDEGCVGALGTRSLLRFDMQIPNTGEGDLFLGDPAAEPLYTYAECHDHYHLGGFERFTLLDDAGVEVAVANRQEFCVMDWEPISLDAPPALYDCSNQGLQTDWAMVNEAGLPCEWIDVTDLLPGEYTLRVEVNPDRIVAESDYSNDSAEVPVVIE